MTFRNKSNNDDRRNEDSTGGNSAGQQEQMVDRAIRYSRTTRQDRRLMREALQLVDLVADPHDQPDDPTVPPRNFVEALRKPTRTPREAIVVVIDGKNVPLVLNHQGRSDPDREAELWAYIRNLVQGGEAG